MKNTTTEFDPLMKLSYARTALDDPHGLTEDELPDPSDASACRLYAIERIDEVMGALAAGHGNDLDDEVVWALKNIGRLLSNVLDEYEGDEGIGGDGEPFGPDGQVVAELTAALDHLDTAMGILS